jgi:predicted DNA-binding protein
MAKDDKSQTFRLPSETYKRIFDVSVEMTKRAKTQIPASIVVKGAVERGLADLEKELGLAPAPKAKRGGR